MKYWDKQTKKYQERKSNKLDTDYFSDKERKERKKTLKIFCERYITKMGGDKYWWWSLVPEEQWEIYNDFYRKRSEWLFDNASSIDEQLFWETTKADHPGDLQLKRDMILKQLTK